PNNVRAYGAPNAPKGNPNDSHARAGQACLSYGRPPHTPVMASSRMRRLRKTGAVDQDGNVVIIPRLPPVAGSNKPPGWKRWSPPEKAEHLLGLSLDRLHDYLSWPAADLDPHRLAAQTQVIRVVVMVAAKVGDEARLQRDRDRMLAELSAREFGRAP